MWYFNFCERALAPYFSRMALAQMRRATRPILAIATMQFLRFRLNDGVHLCRCDLKAANQRFVENLRIGQRDRAHREFWLRRHAQFTHRPNV